MTDVSGPPAPFDAIIVAGGAGSRLGGASKPDLDVGGTRLLDRALAAVAGAAAVVVVGGPRREGVPWTVEDPPGSGPAAGLAAGLAALAADGRVPSAVTVVLGVDTPLAGAAVPALAAAADGGRGAWLVDAEGFAQPLLAAYPTAGLAARCGGSHVGVSLRRLVDGLPMGEVADVDGVARDLDTWDDARWWKELLG